MKTFLRRHLPTFFRWYHMVLIGLANVRYGFPSRKMVIVGVTGTNGKTSTAYLIERILEEAGIAAGMTSTAVIRIKGKEVLNTTKMTMPGRFALQRTLRDMRRQGVRVAIVETSSEGIAQYRHLGIAYDIAVFTNITPEHIESHGSFERYMHAKERLFTRLGTTYRKPNVKKQMVVNADDPNAGVFLQHHADEKWVYSLKPDGELADYPIVKAKTLTLLDDGIRMEILGAGHPLAISSPLIGRHVAQNLLAATTAALALGVPSEKIDAAVKKIDLIPGRLEKISGPGYTIVVDYAHEPAAYKSVLEAVKTYMHPRRLIAVIGSAGGGRDKARREILGEMAGDAADLIVVTNEDPYDENPQTIIEAVARGVERANRKMDIDFWKILSRRQGIEKALELAKSGDVVLITGKGCEQWIMGAKGRKVKWDDRVVVRQVLEEMKNPKKPDVSPKERVQEKSQNDKNQKAQSEKTQKGKAEKGAK